MTDKTERFWYPSTATMVVARRLVPLLLFTLGAGLFVWAGRDYYYWLRPWAVAPEAVLGLLSWLVGWYLFTLLPEVRADEEGLIVRRLGFFLRRIAWADVAGVRQTARVDVLGWDESLYTLYVWRSRGAHRRAVRAFRFSGHICNCTRLLELVRQPIKPVR
jgi:Bacterial PH domain